jgi:hypothetical protein
MGGKGAWALMMLKWGVICLGLGLASTAFNAQTTRVCVDLVHKTHSCREHKRLQSYGRLLSRPCRRG